MTITKEMSEMLHNQPKPSERLYAFIQGRCYERFGVPDDRGNWSYEMSMVDDRDVPLWLSEDAAAYREERRLWSEKYEALRSASLPPLDLVMDQALAKFMKAGKGDTTEAIVTVPRDEFDRIQKKEGAREEVVLTVAGGAVRIRPGNEYRCE